MAMPHIDDGQRRRLIMERHRLRPDRRTDDVASIVRSVVCLHASDPATVFLSAMARMREPSVGAIEDALYEDHTLIRHHAMRRTLFVFPVDAVADAHWSTTTAIADREAQQLVRFIEEDGLADDGAAWIADARSLILAEVERRGATTTRTIGSALPEVAHTLRVRGASLSTHSRMLLVMGLEGSVVRQRPVGSWISSQYLWSTMASCYPGVLDPADEQDVETAEVGVVRRYVAAFGPVTTNDVAWWTGWGMTRARRALAGAGAVEVRLDAGTGWLAPDDEPTRHGAGDPVVAYLPGLDSTVMGWKDRDFYLAPEVADRLFDRNGNAGPTVWLDGRVVGGWVQRADGSIVTELLDPRADAHRPLIEREAERVASMLGDVRHRVRFPAPLQRDRYE